MSGAAPGHRHRPVRTVEQAYRGAIYPARRPNRAAHGWKRIVDTCSCGATRHTNLNGSHREYGYWEVGEAAEGRSRE